MSYLCQLFKKNRDFSFPGCFSAVGGIAEKIPVEPDQGNACAGKVAPYLSTLHFRSISLKSFFQQICFK
jgi:hypothetical protein